VTAGVACAAALLLASACARPPAPLVSVHKEPTGAGTRLLLIGAPGTRINARLAPSLERRDGSVLRFAGGRVTPDSSYFVAPPTLDVIGDPAGIIRASVCPSHESVCRRVEVMVR